MGGEPAAKIIAGIMGQEVKESIRQVAFVKCAGTCEKTGENYIYDGVQDCEMLSFVPGGGAKACAYGCLGYGSCVKACPFDAISIVNGVAVVDKEACKACGKCVAKCPRHLIELVPYAQSTFVACSSRAKGKAVTTARSAKRPVLPRRLRSRTSARTLITKNVPTAAHAKKPVQGALSCNKRHCSVPGGMIR